MNKEEVLKVCLDILLSHKQSLQSALNEIEESMQNETKSSLGDKHETARAKMQVEHEKLLKQQSELNNQVTQLKRVEATRKNTNCDFGALVYTDKATFFLSVAIGKIVMGEKPIMVISTHSPIAKLMQPCKLNESFEMNGVSYTIRKME